MPNHQADWAMLLSMATDKATNFAAVANTTADTADVCKGTCGPSGELHKIILEMISAVYRGSPGSHIAQEVGGLGAEAKRSLNSVVAHFHLAKIELGAANIKVQLMASKVKTAHDRVLGI